MRPIKVRYLEGERRVVGGCEADPGPEPLQCGVDEGEQSHEGNQVSRDVSHQRDGG